MIELPSKLAPEPYRCDAESVSGFVRPQRKLWRTWLKRPRPVSQFAPPLQYDPGQEVSDREISAQWREHIFIEDWVLVLHRDGSVSSRRHMVLQLHSSEALANWDELQRTYDSRTQYLTVPTAKLHLPDGTVRYAAPTLHRVQLPGNGSNSHGRILQLFFSPLKPGVILEYEEQYDDYSCSEFWPGICDDFYLKTNSPCRHRRFVIAVARPFTLQYHHHHGAPAPCEQTHDDYHVCTWEVSDVEGIAYDEWTPPPRDFAPWVDVTTATSWAPFAAKFVEELEPGDAIPSEVRQLADELTTDKTDSLDQAKAAYTYAARNVRYGRPSRETEERNIRGPNQIFEDLQGDCKDKSALLVQLLRSMGLTAQLAVIQTGDTGRTPFLPSNRFNHAIVKLTIEPNTYWLDAASGFFAFGELPSIDQDVQALVLDRETFYFERVPTTHQANYLEYRECEGKLDLCGDYQGALDVKFTGEIAAQFRSQLIDTSAEECTNVLQGWLGTEYAGAIGSHFSFNSPDDLSGSTRFYCQVKIPQVARQIKRIVLLRIPWADTLSLSGPMAQEVRTQPLSLPRAHRVFERHTIELPDQVDPLAIPEPVTLEIPWGKYSCHWQSLEQRLVCERQLQLAGDFVPIDRFPAFKEFWRQACWADSTPLVLQNSS